MQVFLGLPWALTYASARVAHNQLRMSRSAQRRRQEEDAEAREATLAPLRAEREMLIPAAALRIDELNFQHLTRGKRKRAAPRPVAELCRAQRPSPSVAARRAPYDGAVSAEPISLSVQRAGDETERLIAHLSRALAEEAQVTQPGPVPFEGTRVTVNFNDGRPRADAEQRVREVLNGERDDWPGFLRFD
jgi:hypothetical protein